jgi:hypothetical protein
MSSNFYNTSGIHLNGLELHEYVAAPAVPMSMHPHASGQYDFFRPLATLWKKADKVTSDNWSMMQQGYDFYRIFHFPVPVPPPGAGEGAALGKIILTSGSKCQMAVMSVTSDGNPLACCVTNMFSTNQNCSDPIDLEINLVVNLNSVVTSPTAGDFKAAFYSGLLDKFMGLGLGKLFEKGGGKLRNELLQEIVPDALKQTWRRLPDVVPLIEDWSTKPVAKFVKQMVDGDAQ